MSALQFGGGSLARWSVSAVVLAAGIVAFDCRYPSGDIDVPVRYGGHPGLECTAADWCRRESARGLSLRICEAEWSGVGWSGMTLHRLWHGSARRVGVDCDAGRRLPKAGGTAGRWMPHGPRHPMSRTSPPPFSRSKRSIGTDTSRRGLGRATTSTSFCMRTLRVRDAIAGVFQAGGVRQLWGMAHPAFYLWEVSKASRCAAYPTIRTRGREFGSAERRKIVASGGDFAAIGYEMVKDQPVAGLDGSADAEIIGDSSRSGHGLSTGR